MKKLPAFLIACVTAVLGASASPQTWSTVAPASGALTNRHECSFVELAGQFYLIGGRRINPVDIYNPATNAWTQSKPTPVEIHHFQALAYQDRILIVGAMTGRSFPKEPPLPVMMAYKPSNDTWSEVCSIPADRLRGGAGAVIYKDTLYLVCGIQMGHWGGHVAWTDALDLKTMKWRRLPDAPRARDHFQTAILDGKLYAVGGRRSSAETKQTFHLVVPEVDVFDLATETWTALPAESNLPNPRAGTSTVAADGKILVIGGESMEQNTAHKQVHAFDPKTGKWTLHSELTLGRHGSGVILYKDALYIASGSGSRGGKPELESMEKFSLK
jgi:N-acetylneuraminic acid mutarotase